MLSAHYRSPLNFSHELMESARSAYERICNAVDNLTFLESGAASGEMTGEEKERLPELQSFTEKFDAAMEDDINTADALAVVFDLVRYANVHVSGESSKAYIQAVKEELFALCAILGLRVSKEEEVLDGDIEALIAERQAARKAKDFKKADEIRDKLASMGITLLDTREGVKWKRA
jgi:cysteinyl-tRNA synthetase